MEAPFYIVFAGVNGAGKSTLFETGLWRTRDMPQRMMRVNPDEIVRSSGGDWESPEDNVKAGKEALRRIEACFEKRRSFNQETTLTGHLALKNIKRAKELGYRVFLFYIGVDDLAVALARIQHRVSTGGHGIDGATVERRYRSSLSALARSLDYCDQAFVFDNTKEFSCLAMWQHGTLVWWGGGALGRNWLADAIADDALWQRNA